MRLIQQGSRDAKILICGEAPGATEESTGVPFSGGSGDLLNRMLSRVGISRNDCFITNICHTKPPGNEFNWFLKPKIRPELIYGLGQLKRDIDEIKPNLVIALGAQPLRFLTGKVGIDKWRGSILESAICPSTKVIATYHPAYILRVWDYKGVAELDLLRCADEALTPAINIPQRELVTNPTRELAVSLVSELREAEWLAVDIECWESDTGWKLACVGFSDRPGRAVTLPCDEPWQLALIKELCESPAKKVLQNGTFDSTVLRENGITLRNFAWDTMLAHHSLYPECASSPDEISSLGGKKRQSAIRKGLAFLVSINTKQPFYKDDGKLWKKTGDLQLFWRYNGLDACCTREIRDVQEIDLNNFGTTNVFDHEMSLVQPLMGCTNRGIKIDLALRKELTDKYEIEIQNLQRVLDKVAGGSFNVKSSKQITDLLYNKLGLPPKYKQRASGDRTITADKDAVVELAGKYNHPVLAIILAIRQHRDFVERYLTAKVDADGRMRCSFDITGTRTGRLSSRQSIYGSGTNLQNIPARRPEGEAIRRMFIPDDGKVFVYRDYSQAEARVVAYLSGAERLIELFEDSSRDVHKENAARIFGKPVSDVSIIERYLAKRVIHASNYGMEADRLVQVVNEDAATTGIRIDRNTAANLIHGYFMLYPEIREVYWKEVERELKFSRTLVTPFGRKRTFYGRWEDKLLKEAYSYIPQSVVGWLGAEALARCYYEIEPVVPGAEVLLNVHDSDMMQCWIEDVEKVAGMMREVMNIPITIKGRTFTIPTDCLVGYNWGHKKEDNPQGLIEIDEWLKERAA